MNQDLTTLICLFHHRDEADSARKDILRVNVPEQSVTLIASDGSHPDALATLSDLGLPSRDLHHLLNGLEHGGVVLAVDSVSHLVEKVEAIFRAHEADPVNKEVLDDGGDSSPALHTEAASARSQVEGGLPEDLLPGRTGSDVGRLAIPVVHEEMQVGKRRIDTGGVRVFRRIVEVPVNQEVTLRDQNIHVERRAVDRPVSDSESATAGEEVIELAETREELVVTKAARVFEEIVVGRETADRIQHVQETLRHTEVDVQQIAPNERT